MNEHKHNPTPLLFGTLLVAVLVTALAGNDFSAVRFPFPKLSVPNGSLTVAPHTQLAQVADVTSGLVGWWKFDEGSGTTAADSSGVGSTVGTLTGSPLPVWTSQGKINGALTFNGSASSYVTTNLGVNTYPLTACAWVNLTQNTGLAYIFRSLAFDLYVINGSLQMYNNVGSIFTAAGLIPLNTWKHVCASIDSAHNSILYIDGVSVATGNVGAAPGSGLWDIGPGFTGTIDDARIYNRVLYATDVQGVYTAVSSVSTTPMPAPATGAPVISAVSTSGLTSSSATIGWTTDQPADSTVEYGPTTAYGSNTAVNSTLVTSHTVVLSGLTANTTYHFRVDSKNAASQLSQSADATFVTSAAVTGTSGNGPAAPTYFSAEPVSPTQVNLIWYQSADTGNTVSSYTIYRNGSVIATVPANIYIAPYQDTEQNYYEDQAVRPGVSYTYYVVAHDSANLDSPHSVSLTATTPQGSAALIPANRLVDWTPGVSVGVPGGIPTNRTQIIDVTQAPYNADKTGVNDAAAAINQALVAAPAGGVVYLPTGTYRLNSTLYVQRSNVTIRGDGPGLTTIDDHVPSYAIYFRGVLATTDTTMQSQVVAGTAKGSTQLTLVDATNFKVGQMLEILRSNDTSLPAVTPYGYQYVRTQKAYITAKSGNTLTITPPLYTDYTSPNTFVITTYSIAANDGIENLSLNVNSNPTGILYEGTYASWIKNVTVYNAGNYPVELDDALMSEVRHSNLSTVHSGTSGASLIMDASTANLIEDNIISDCYPVVLMVNRGSAGNVFAYNYFKNGETNSNHNAHNSYNLFEGNYMDSYLSDGYYGSESETTLFRNYISTFAALKRFSRNFSFIGNILNSYSFGQPNLGNSMSTGVAEMSQGVYWQDWSPVTGPTILGTLTKISDSSGTVTLNNPADAVRLQTYFSNVCSYSGAGCTDVWGLDWGQGKDPTKIRTTMSGMITSAGIVSVNGGYPNALPPTGTIVGIWPRSEGFQELDMDVALSLIRKDNYLLAAKGVWTNENLANGEVLSNSLYLSSKPAWFGSLAWPPYDPSNPTPSADAIPAAYRYNHPGQDTPGLGTVPPPPVSTPTPIPSSSPNSLTNATATSTTPTTLGITTSPVSGSGGAGNNTPSNPLTGVNGNNALPSTTPISNAPVLSNPCPSVIPAAALTLTLGTRSQDVTNLQTFLVFKGYLQQRYITGYFGNLTKAALNAYLSAHPLPSSCVSTGNSPTIDATSASAFNSFTFTRSLKLGSRGQDVKNLQIFLNGHGFTVSTSGAGSLGYESTYFGPATMRAVAAFQRANHISPAYGYFGTVTRGKVNQMLGR